MTTDLDETRLQLYFSPVNVYVEDAIVVSDEEHGISSVSIIISCREIKLTNIYPPDVFSYLV